MLADSASEAMSTAFEGFKALDCNESLIAAFERAAATFATRTALGSNLWEPTYRDLNTTANRLAHRLIARGMTSGDRVAVLMLHDAPLIAAVLGILKAGCVVVALEPIDPVARLKMLIQDAEPALLVTDTANRSLATECGLPDHSILNFESEAVAGPEQNPTIAIPPQQTAFLTYTSGTTGRPKGVMQTHRQFRRSAASYDDAMAYTPDDHIPLFSMVSTGFGAGSGLWSALLHGARLCPFSPKTTSIASLADWVIAHRLTVYVSSASLFRTLAKTITEGQVFDHVRAVMLHGEMVTSDDFELFLRHFPQASFLVHTLSSSETANIAWWRWMPGDHIPAGPLPVGRFARDMDILLLGDDGEPVAPGDIGEIAVRSHYLANGYWRDPELTGQRFSADPCGVPILRTGDQGRINAAGLLEYRGRKDDRIKIRGFRIELLEVEAAFKRLPGIDRVAVTAIARNNFEPMLAAFVVKANSASWSASRLRHALRANLPLHMIPSRIVFLESLPYSRSNKIDREALREHHFPARANTESDRPRSETETILCEIWAEVLDVRDVGRDDDFFGLGGDSLIGAVVAAQIHAAFGIALTLVTIADHPTVSALAAFIDEKRRTDAINMRPIERAPRARCMPMSLLQEMIWNNWREREDRARMTHVRSYRISGPLNIEIMKDCLRYLVDRHEILRTTFGIVDGQAAQLIHQSGPPNLSFIDLSAAADPETQADSIFQTESSQEIKLDRLPIRRNILIRISDNLHRLLRVSHPLIIDGLGSQILDAEFAILYEAMLHGEKPPLPKESRLQYADFAVWQRQVMQPGRPYFNDVISWWKAIAPAAVRPQPGYAKPHQRFDPNEGVLRWKLEEGAARQLDEVARRIGATHFTARLAAFVALIAHTTCKQSVVVGTGVANRNRMESQGIVGPFLTPVHLVFSHDESKTFIEWLEIVRDHVFEATTRGELPHHIINEHLRASGVELPKPQFYFAISRDHSDQCFGGLVVSDDFWKAGTMPSGCMIYVDERRPENCRVNFDANVYDKASMCVMLNRYLRLLEAVAREPHLPMRTLLMTAHWEGAINELMDMVAPTEP